MKGTRVAARYAKSLLGLSLEKGVLEDVYKDMKMLLDTCKENRDFVNMLKSPIIKPDKKKSILHELFADNVNALTLDFIDLITSKKRGDFFPEIIEAFIEEYKTYKKIVTVVITSAVGLDDKLKEQALQMVQRSKDSEVELVENIDKDLIGGFVLRVSDKQIDASISRKIRELKHSFMQTSHIANN